MQDSKQVTKPISRTAKNFKVNYLRVITSVVVFVALIVVSSIALVNMQLWAVTILATQVPLWLIVPRQKQNIRVWYYHYYKTIIRLTEKSFGSCLVFIAYILTPNTQLVLSGDYKDLETIEKTILYSNHQIYPDWVYLWLLARKYNRHGDLKIMLIAILKMLPLFGWGMTFFEFIFMNQKLVLDYKTILNSMEKQRELYQEFPLWMIIFPEGSLNVPQNRITSEKYAKKYDINERPEYVLLPRASGLFMVADSLKEQVDYIFDLTVGYSGLECEDIPYEEYLLENTFFCGKFPRQIHIHIRKYKLDTIPGMSSEKLVIDEKGFSPETTVRKDEFSRWLIERFMEKDSLMKRFYSTGRLSDEALTFIVKPNIFDWITLALVWYCAYFSIPFVYGWIISLLNYFIHME
jgi:1-acyl-sn-glycerol-3-phosphate acyltransferase